MYRILLTLVFTCVYATAYTQVNYVKNPSFEEYSKCPDNMNQLIIATNWNCAVDTVGEPFYTPEYNNVCASFVNVGVPHNFGGYQNSRTGDAYIGAGFYYDKTAPLPAGATTNWRDYAQGHLVRPLQNGKIYCVTFFVSLAEVSGYAHNKIGAYIDNGAINRRTPAGVEITDLTPQVYSHSIVKDTVNWVRVEGSFIATGGETHITLGNFAKQADVDTAFLYWGAAYQYSYYYIDDVSVIPIDLAADAGTDTWVEQGSKRKIGRVGDTTTLGLDCKWYHKGALIDSGAIISVNANAVRGVVDTYVVVQTICGVVKSDTVLVTTVGLGMQEFGFENSFTVYPNPTNGVLNIHSDRETGEKITAIIYDLTGRVLCNCKLPFTGKDAVLTPSVPEGSYLLELRNEFGTVKRERIVFSR